ncbi:MlaD family protein [Candidatus Similichlamydia epinepheli]|uniref:MlaD family protein n=1 Tax=Candidatus Similichlamydia epinepheli TaxID=1903953 RepID=UPI0013009751|nr:MlaD family protein [Candidatus Similichlamydia epinepheli]
MREGTRNTLVGLFIVSGTFILLSLALFLRPNLGDGKRIIRVRFNEIDRLTVGSRVCFAGKSVGRVVDVQYVPDARRKSFDRQGRVYPFELTLSVDSIAKILKTDQIFPHNIGLLGERVVFIRPTRTHEQVEEAPDQEIFWAQPAVEFEDMLAEINQLIEKVSSIEKELLSFLQKSNQILGTLGNATGSIDLSDLQDQLSRFMMSFQENVFEGETINEFKSLLKQFSRIIQSIEGTLIQLSSMENLENNILSQGILSLQQIFDALNSGEGTLGRLLQSQDLYQIIKSLFEHATQLVEAIKKYGVFFQNNKEWKRFLQEQEREKAIYQSEQLSEKTNTK